MKKLRKCQNLLRLMTNVEKRAYNMAFGKGVLRNTKDIN